LCAYAGSIILPIGFSKLRATGEELTADVSKADPEVDADAEDETDTRGVTVNEFKTMVGDSLCRGARQETPDVWQQLLQKS
jgi:hypothetical protein